jgi:hypothetical protein
MSGLTFSKEFKCTSYTALYSIVISLLSTVSTFCSVGFEIHTISVTGAIFFTVLPTSEHLRYKALFLLKFSLPSECSLSIQDNECMILFELPLSKLLDTSIFDTSI